MALTAETIGTRRLSLEPLRATDADEMAAVLADERLYEFVGGQPHTLPQLRVRYAALAAGSPEGSIRWLNWIVRRRFDSRPIGTVQATVADQGDGPSAHIAWVIGVEWQNQGFASEAACALVQWLRARGTLTILANIHPGHVASAKVAQRAGLQPTGEEANGEQVWRARE